MNTEPRIFCKLFTGKITVNDERLTYALTINYTAPEIGTPRNYDKYTAVFTAANSKNEIVDMFERCLDSRYGARTPEGIRREMLDECRENFY